MKYAVWKSYRDTRKLLGQTSVKIKIIDKDLINIFPKEWKVSACGEKFTCLLACSPACFVSTEKLSTWVYWKLFCRFWLIKPHNLSHVVLVVLIFREFSSIIPFTVWLQDFTQIKGTGYISVSSINFRQKYFFFQLKVKYPVFHFLDLHGTMLNLI